MTRRTSHDFPLHAQPRSPGVGDSNHIGPVDPRADLAEIAGWTGTDRYAARDDWGYAKTRTVDISGRFLELEAWTHHGTTWITLTGALTLHTAMSLHRFFDQLRPGAPAGAVLNVCGINHLDRTGVLTITAEHRLLERMGRHLTIVATLQSVAA